VRQRVLGRSGLRVSELCLGTMTFGTSWGWGADEATCGEIYRAFREAGGDFVDTANLYTGGESEEILGRLVAPERDQVVLGTKYTLPTSENPNAGGSHRKSLRLSVEASLRRLGTDYLDVLWVHAWDQCTPMDETLRALDDVVRAGKVLAIGVSNTPAWVIARSDAIAELRGWNRFCALQVEYSLVARTPERELLPMAATLGLSVSGWSPLARGLLAGKPRPADAPPPSEPAPCTIEVATQVAGELGVTPAQLALAWVAHRGVLPVLGVTKVAQLRDNLAATRLQLDDEHFARLDAVSDVRLGYPHEFLRDRCPTLSPPS
jgi:aryl-alcohol dehydrogenase-like predicted oxidoreductase